MGVLVLQSEEIASTSDAVRRKQRKLKVFRTIDFKGDNLLDFEEVMRFYHGNESLARNFWTQVMNVEGK